MHSREALLALGLVVLLNAPAFAAEPASPGPKPGLDLIGDPLPPGAVARLGVLRLRHGDVVNSLCFSSDGKLLASAGNDRVVRLWDPATGRLVRKLEGHTNLVRAVVFAPGGKVLFSAALDNTICRWDVATGKLRQTLTDHLLSASVLAVSARGDHLASAGIDKTVRLWDLKSGEVIQRITGHTGEVVNLEFSPDGKRILSSARDRTLHVWAVETGKQVRVVTPARPAPGAVFRSDRTSFARSPDGKTLAVAVAGSPIAILDEDVRKVLRRFPSTGLAVGALAFSPDGKTLASTGPNDGIHLWDPESGRRFRTCGEPGRDISALAFSPDSKTLASAEGCAICLWDVASGKQLDRGEGHLARITCVGFDPTGKRAATGSLDGSVRLWDSATGKPRQRLTGHRLGVQSLAFAPRGRLLATGARDEKVRLWDSDTGAAVRTLECKKPGVFSLAFSPDAGTLAVGGLEMEIHLWDLQTAKRRQSLGRHAGAVHSLVYLSDGKRLAAASLREKATLWDLASGREIHQFRSGGFGRCSVACSRDGKMLATISGGSVLLFETDMGRKLREIEVESRWLNGVALSPDGKTVASVGVSRLVRLWDAQTGKVRHELDGHEGSVFAAAFSDDGKYLLTGGDDGTALVWDLAALRKGVPAPPPVLVRDRDDLWQDLASEDAERAYRAILRLSESPRPAVALLEGKLRPISADSGHALLVANLGSKEQSIRDSARAELVKLGALAEAALRRALANNPNPSVKQEVEALLKKLREPVRSSGRLRGLRAVEVLEQLDTPGARAVLESLAKGAPEAELTREAAASLRRLHKKKTDR